ncbi:unnamed protein product, partial [Meganyctiphanes norvegica]
QSPVAAMAEGLFRTSLLFVGGATLLYCLLTLLGNIVNLFRYYVWARLVKGQPWTTRFGQWAVVTGASDGIGKAYVHKLAAKGMNVVLIARNKEKLDKVAQDIRTEYGIETLVVIADFAKGQSIYGHIAKELEGKDIGVLVNNVGVIGQLMTLFCDWEEKNIWDIINVNIGNVPAVTKIVLPGMLQRKRGIIINLASIVSLMPHPRSAIYTASKAFIDFFTQALAAECEGTGVLVQGVHPGLVLSNMTKSFKDHTDLGKLPSFLFPTVDVYVDSAFATVGHTDYTHGYWGHSVLRVIFKCKMALPFKAGIRSIMKKETENSKELLKNMKND